MWEKGTTRIAHRRTSTGVASRRFAGLAGGGLGFAALAAVLVLVAPMSSAHGTVTFTAPYNGFTSTTSAYVNHTGCAHATNPTPATWNASTGSFQFAAATSAASCTRGADGYAEAFTTITSTLFSAPFNGFGSVDVVMSSAFTAKAALNLATSGNASGAFSEVALYVSVYVYDATHHNGTFFGYATTYLVDQYFYTSSSAFALSQGWTTSYLYASGTFAAGHVYQADVSIGAYVFTDSYGNGGSTGSASLDLGGSNGLVISSITAY